jgi:heme-degrading monooxygenase HmoA
VKLINFINRTINIFLFYFNSLQTMIAATPQPPYYAVIFTSLKKNAESDYAETAERMVALAEKQPGFLGIESAGNELGITVSYWQSLEAIKQWKQHAEHLTAQKKGRETYYSQYRIRICRVERDYAFEAV